jgi:hypothetical protein
MAQAYLGNTALNQTWLGNTQINDVELRVPEVPSGVYAYYDASNLTSYPGSGSTWFDLSGNGNHLTLTGSVSFTNSFGGIFDFSGSNTSIQGAFRNANLSPFNSGSGQVTFIAWFNPQRLTGSLATSENILIAMNRSDNTELWPGLSLDEKVFSYNPYGDAGGFFTSNIEPLLNEWTMRAFVTAATGSTKMWSPTQIDLFAVTGSLNQTYYKKIQIGSFPDGFDNNYNYSGSIAQVAIYNRTLTDLELSDFYNATKYNYI